MSDWNAELDTFFEGRGQEGEARFAEGTSKAAEFIASVAVPAFEAFGAALQNHRRHVRLRRSDASMRILVDYAGTEEFDFTLWAGMDVLSTESRTDGRRELGGFQNGKGTNAMADTTIEDIAHYLTARYTLLNSRATV